MSSKTKTDSSLVFVSGFILTILNIPVNSAFEVQNLNFTGMYRITADEFKTQSNPFFMVLTVIILFLLLS